MCAGDSYILVTPVGEDLLEEYIMNTSGRIWVGSKKCNQGKPWLFGQFDESALESALYVLDISTLPDAALSNPVLIARTFSKMVNSFDDDGILEGSLRNMVPRRYAGDCADWGLELGAYQISF